MSARSDTIGDEAQLTIRRLRSGVLRAFVGEQQLGGVKGITIECVGFGIGSFLLRVSGAHVRLDDETKAT